jgi:hypothetical protein
MLVHFSRKIALVAIPSLVLAAAGCNQSRGGGTGSSVAGATSGTAATGSAAIVVAPLRDWTVMVFVNATNNLEPGLLASVKAMETVGSSANVNVVVEMQTKTMPFGAPFDCQAKRMLMKKDADPARISSPGLALLGDVDTTSPDEIASFVTWTKTRFPARHYAIILNDHGGGWMGFGQDEVNHRRGSYAKLEAIASKSGAALGQRFDIFGFDACLNAAIEVQSLLAPVARIGLAHEESVPASWNYRAFLADLIQQPTMDGPALARTIVARTQSFVTGVDADEATEDGNINFQMSAIDLDKLPAVVSAFARYTNKNSANIAALLPALAVARARSLTFERVAPPNGGLMVDLGDLAAHLGAKTPDADLDATRSAIASAIIAQATSALNKNASGISIYFPTPDTGYTLNAASAGDYSETAFAKATGWDAYLAAYVTATATRSPSGAATTLTAGNGGLTFTVDATNTAQLSLNVANANGLSFGALDIDPTATTIPSAAVTNSVALSDGQTGVFAEWRVMIPGSGIYAARVQLVGPHTPGYSSVDVLCQRDPAGTSATLIGIAYRFPQDDGSTSYELVPARDLVGAVASPVHGDRSLGSPVGAEKLSVAVAPLPSGSYTLTLQPIDWATNGGAVAQMTMTVP